MGVFGKLFGKGSDDPGEPVSMPWDQRPSIYEHISSHVSPEQPGLTEGGDTLPDEERVNEGSGLRWAAGALDGVMSHHMGTGKDKKQVKKAVDLTLAYCRQPTAKHKADLYQQIIDGNVLPLIDPIIEALLNNERLNHDRLHELTYSFVTEAPDREPVKFGLAILGLYQEPENEPLFQTLGRHEEFTLFCAVALSNVSSDPEQSLWTLAKNVFGWGRIHVVERLAETENPEIKDWLLREGYRNSIMNEYLACTCATAGGLLSALSADTVDRELLTCAGEILEALTMGIGGPAEGMDDYEDGALAVEMYLGHMESSAETLADFGHVSTIKQYFLDYSDADWEARAENGWTSERRERLQAMCEGILNRPEWADQARSGLSSDDEMEFQQANMVAEALGIDTWEHHWYRLQEKPDDSGRWFDVMARCNEDRIDKVIAFAEEHIDLDWVATGAGSELGIGPGFEPHMCLVFVIQKLRHYPGYGEKLIEAALKSPAVQNRNMAINALAAWGRENWSESMREALTAASQVEPEDDVRERMEKALKGEPLDD